MFILDLEVTDFIEYIPSTIGKSVEMNIVRIYRDEEWFEKNFPILEKFWADVQYWRTQDITTHPDYEKYFGAQPEISASAPNFMFIEDDEKRPESELEEKCLFED
jgi:hypothetical protein